MIRDFPDFWPDALKKTWTGAEPDDKSKRWRLTGAELYEAWVCLPVLQQVKNIKDLKQWRENEGAALRDDFLAALNVPDSGGPDTGLSHPKAGRALQLLKQHELAYFGYNNVRMWIGALP